jgi:hypothetical protein
MNRLITEAGPKPQAWVICGQARIAAVTDRSAFVFWQSDSIHSLTLGYDGLWREHSPYRTVGVGDQRMTVKATPPPPEPVPVVDIDCQRHGRHPVDGERLARHARVYRRLQVAELSPVGGSV